MSKPQSATSNDHTSALILTSVQINKSSFFENIDGTCLQLNVTVHVVSFPYQIAINIASESQKLFFFKRISFGFSNYNAINTTLENISFSWKLTQVDAI